MRLNTKCVSMRCTRDEYTKLWEGFTDRNKKALLELDSEASEGDAIHSVDEAVASAASAAPVVDGDGGVEGSGDDSAVASAASAALVVSVGFEEVPPIGVVAKVDACCCLMS